jgi:hypothetical protein
MVPVLVDRASDISIVTDHTDDIRFRMAPGRRTLRERRSAALTGPIRRNERKLLYGPLWPQQPPAALFACTERFLAFAAATLGGHQSSATHRIKGSNSKLASRESAAFIAVKGE